MKVSYEESVANYFGLQRRGGPGDRSVLSVRAGGEKGSGLFKLKPYFPAA